MMRKRHIVLYALGIALLVYAVVNAVWTGNLLCRSFSCQALQEGALWWAGAVYGALLLWAFRYGRVPLGVLVVVGMAVEGFLVLTQVLLNLYCPACLGYTFMFVLWVILARPEIVPVAKRAAWGVAAVTLCAALAIVPLARAVCTCSDTPFTTVSGDDQNLYLFFEPNCRYCHSILEMLEKMASRDRVRLCPEAWSLGSVWKLVQNHCRTCASWPDKFRCVMSTLTVVRANNAFCMERGLSHVPLVVHQGRIVAGPEVPGYLLSALNVSLRGSDPQDLLFPTDSGGSCTVNACD